MLPWHLHLSFGDCVPDVKPLVTDVHGRVTGEAGAILDVIPPLPH